MPSLRLPVRARTASVEAAAQGAPPAARSGGRSRAGDVVRVAAGNFVEMYDFMVFAYFAPAIGRAFFPAGDAAASLLLTLATFGAGFLMRPLGAVVLGAYTDRHGRRAGLLLTLSLMSVGIVTLAFTPGYAQIGVAAPLLVLGGRLLQGFSAGAELGNVSVYLSEIAPPGRKGFFVAWQSASQQVAVLAAAVIGVALTVWLTPAQVSAWGWRLPLAFGCLIVPVVFLLRRGLRESDAFAARARRTELAEVFAGLWRARAAVATGVGLVVMTTVSFYLITATTPTFAALLHLPPRGALWVTAAVGLSNLLWLPTMGALSDRIGRKPILVACTALAIATAYPVMHWLAAAPSVGRLLAVELWLSALYASYNAAMVAWLTEVAPAAVRASGFSLAYSTATALGGFTPYVVTWLIARTHDRAMPGAWLTAAAAVGLVAALVSRRAPEAEAEARGA